MMLVTLTSHFVTINVAPFCYAAVGHITWVIQLLEFRI